VREHDRRTVTACVVVGDLLPVDLCGRHERNVAAPRDVGCAEDPRQSTRQNGGVTTDGVSEIFDPAAWREVPGFEFDDITYHRSVEHGTVRIAFDRAEVRTRSARAPSTSSRAALDHARMTTDVGCVLLTGNGPSPKDGGWAFCSGGDQRIRGRDGYKYADGDSRRRSSPAAPDGCTSSRSNASSGSCPRW
jgi:hypothetical protein